MANKPIGMSKLRHILKMHCQGESKSKICKVSGTSRKTIRKYIAQFISLQTTWEEIGRLTDKSLDDLFGKRPKVEPPQKLKDLHDYLIENEKRLKQRGVTRLRLWYDYIEKYPSGFMQTTFYRYFNLWRNRSYPSMHMEHKVGDKVFVDFTGVTLPVIDELTGEIKQMEVFVAILGASQLTYVEATESQKLEDFIGACENALHYFGGTPSAFVPDNLRPAVNKSSKYEPIINENFQAFADHYGMVVLPARAYKPKDKSLVEGAVKISYNRIFAALYDTDFFSLPQLNQSIWQELENHNNTLFQGRNYSRRTHFEEIEKSVLQSLPELRYELRNMVVITVMKNGHVCLHCDRHYYSVPYGYIGKKVRLLFSKSKIEIRYRYEVIATHVRIKNPHGYTTEKTHLASQHLFVTEWNPQRFMEEANALHPDVAIYIEQILLRKPHAEQAYKSCMGILSFAKRMGKDRLIRACQRAHGYGLYNYGIIENILKRGLDKNTMEDEPLPTHMPAHENIRGGEYYQ